MAFAPMLALIGGAISAVGAIVQGNAQANAARYQAQVAQNNATIALQMAANSQQTAQAKAAQQSMKEAAIGGEIKAAQAAGGVDVNTGSNVNVQQSQREIGNLNTQNIIQTGEVQAYGYRAQATNFQAQAGLEEYEAPIYSEEGYLGAAGDVFGAASKFYAPGTSSNPVVGSNSTFFSPFSGG